MGGGGGVYLICMVILFFGKYGTTDKKFRKFKAKDACTINLYFIIKYVD